LRFALSAPCKCDERIRHETAWRALAEGRPREGLTEPDGTAANAPPASFVVYCWVEVTDDSILS
jgi:hypothetical protein